MADVTIAIKAQNQASAALRSVRTDLEQIQRAAGGMRQALGDAGKAGSLGGVRGALDGVTRSAGAARSALGSMMQVAGGMLAAEGIMALGRSLAGVTGEALNAYAEFERLGSSLQTLSARELVQAGVVDNMAAGMEMAAGRSKELLGWIEKVAVKSPFNQAEVAAAYKMAAAYGFTGDQAQRLTQAMVDYTAGSGQSGQVMDRIALALGQVHARGRMTAQEMNQLTEAGISARQILAEAFGVTTAELEEMVTKGLIPADLAIEAITSSLENDFGGAAEAQANTFSGLIASLQDLKSIALREFFAGTFQAVQPYLVQFVDLLSDPKIRANIQAVGVALGEWIAKNLERVSQAAQRFYAGFKQGGLAGGLAKMLGVSEFAVKAAGVVAAIGGMITAAAALWPLISAIGAVLAALASPIGLVVAGVAALGAAFATDFMGIRTKTTELWNAIQPKLAEWADWLKEKLPEALGALREKFDEAKGYFSEFFQGQDVAKFKEEMGGVVTEVKSAFGGLFTGELSFGDFREKLEAALGKIPQAIRDLFGGADIKSLITKLRWADFIPTLTWDGKVAGIEWGSFVASLDWSAKVLQLGWGDYVLKLDWSEIVTKLTNWGEYISDVVWPEVITTLSDWGEWITSLDWTKIITTVIDWATWIPALTWTSFVTAIEWGAYIVSLAWDAFVKVLDWGSGEGGFVSRLSWGNFVSALDWLTYIGEFAWGSFIEKLEWTGVLPTMQSWAEHIPQLVWSNIVTTLSNWGEWITSLDWTKIITTAIDWATWIPALVWTAIITGIEWGSYVRNLLWENFVKLLDWGGGEGGFVSNLSWESFVPVLEWIGYIASFAWSSFVEKLEWLGVIDKMSAWGEYIQSLAWSSYVDAVDWGEYVASLAWDKFVATLSSWGEYIEDLAWSSFVSALSAWSDFIPDITWSSFIPQLSWPSAGDILASIRSHLPAVDLSLPGGKALGTDYHAGGLAVVGERGPELVNLPKGAQVIPNGRTTELLRMLGVPGFAEGTAGAGGATPWPVSAPRVDLDRARAMGEEFRRTGTVAAQEFKKAAEATDKNFEKTAENVQDYIEGVLSKTAGLLSPSKVTADDLELAKYGLYVPKADEYLRQARDEVQNGVDWANVSVEDMAAAVNIDPNLPAELILKIFENAWADQSLWANPENIKKFINPEAVQAQMQQQMAQQAGKSNLLAFFGVQPDQAQEEVAALAMQVAEGVAKGITPEVMAPASKQLVQSIAQGVGGTTEAEGAALGDGLSNVLASGIAKAVDQSAADGYIAVVKKMFTSADSVAKLMDVGESIGKAIYEGFKRWSAGADWPDAIPNAPSGGGAAPAPTAAAPVGANALGTSYWAGGWTWIGERGRELVNLPRGSEVAPHREAEAMGRPNVVININATVTKPADERRLARRMMEMIGQMA